MNEETTKLYATIWTSFDFLDKALKTSDPIEKELIVSTVAKNLGETVLHKFKELQNELEKV